MPLPQPVIVERVIMKRFHVHIHVQNLRASIAFYSKLFAAVPTKMETDYAKWMLEDPRVNFAISTRGNKPGLDHLGLQVPTLNDIPVFNENTKTTAEAVCCITESVPASACCAPTVTTAVGCCGPSSSKSACC
jgi:lactoylglutathione lyase